MLNVMPRQYWEQDSMKESWEQGEMADEDEEVLLLDY